MSYSLDFRKRVFEIKVCEKLSFQQTSDRFGVSIRTANIIRAIIEGLGKK